MKQQKFIFCRYSFQEDPDTIPDKRVAIEAVSYTHLRAHETGRNLFFIDIAFRKILILYLIRE